MEVQQVIDESGRLGVTLDEHQARQFTTYCDVLLETNQRFNLTALRTEADVLSLHFCDSLTVLGALSVSATLSVGATLSASATRSGRRLRLLDVGTGAGFPGLPIKIARPDIDVTLIDGTAKKIGFCADVIERLGLSGVRALHARADELAHEPPHRAGYDIVTARAVAALPTLVEYLLPFVTVGGLCIAMKGGTADEEARDAAGAIRALGGRLRAVQPVALPGRDDKRALILIDKIGPTQAKYPRPAGAPRNAPLK
jgi:16S rRNA (guanine527-N7)-methyltransferase